MDRLTEKASTGMCDKNGDEMFLGDKVLLITGDVGEIVFECGSYGVGIQDGIDYDEIQCEMDKADWCCGNRYHGCFNDNYISLWEIWWNFNCEDDLCYPIEIN
ncbi:hypothetical protein KPL26_03210 [Clostridium algidicarnis]|uniref:hypothetical protein n=1 Tax=Clostridium algidicarnis TaxID=37659 RepID=UPI001C0AEDB3|nr:hypothetical protein [Clostridium algidicarnis]MBU3195671.1 hypothetical protein [Clostridium algidicarnis]